MDDKDKEKQDLEMEAKAREMLEKMSAAMAQESESVHGGESALPADKMEAMFSELLDEMPPEMKQKVVEASENMAADAADAGSPDRAGKQAMQDAVNQAVQQQRLEVFSDEVQDILGVVPHWILRWGIVTVFAIVIALVGVSYLVQYPDVIPAPIVVTSSNPPVEVVAATGGKISKLFVEENEQVQRDALLGIIESAADGDIVLGLESELEMMERKWERAGEQLPVFQFNSQGALGGIQPYYSDFLSNYRQLVALIEDEYHDKKIEELQSQIAIQENLLTNYRRQIELVKRDEQLSQEDFERAKRLHDQGTISAAALADKEQEYLARKRGLQDAENVVFSTQNQITEYRKSIEDLRYQRNEQLRTMRVTVRESYNQLRAQIASWKLLHVLVAPIEGKVTFFEFWSDQQHVQTGAVVMKVVPETSELLGRVILENVATGKIEPGQTVQVRFATHPDKEFGVVDGVVRQVSTVPKEGKFFVSVDFPQGLKTSYNKEIDYIPEMQGEARIITKKKRLIERVFSQLRKIFDQSTSP